MSGKIVLPILVGAFLVVRIAMIVRRRARRAHPRAGADAAASPAPARPVTPLGRLLARAVAPLGDVGLVARREVRERVRSRVFRVATLITLLVVAAAVVIPVLHKGTSAPQRVGVVGALSGPLRAGVAVSGLEVGTKVAFVTEPSLSKATGALRAGRVDVVLVDADRILVAQSLTSSDTSTTALLARAMAQSLSLQAGLQRAGIPPLQAAELAHPKPLPVHGLKRSSSPRSTTTRSTAIYGVIFTYILLSQYGTWLVMGVVEEKASRVVEVLLSTVRPGQLLTGKVIGIGLVAMLQAALIVAVALGLGAALGSSLLHGTAPLAVVSSLLWVFLGYAFYCWVFAAGGSLVDRQEQVQALAFPLQLPILIGYITSLIAISSGSASTLIKVFAYLPPTAPFAMPVLVGLGQATWWQFALSVAVTLVGIVVVARAAAAIYYRAILRTGGRVHLRDVLASDSAPVIA